MRPTVPLTAGQVHQVQLGLPDVLVAQGVAVDDLEVDGEDGVGPGGVGVHGGGRGHPVGDALFEQHGHLGYAVHLEGNYVSGPRVRLLHFLSEIISYVKETSESQTSSAAFWLVLMSTIIS